jgi:hypothetical protein
VQTMAHRQLRLPRILRLAALFLLVQSAFALPFSQTRANLNPRTFYRGAGSLVGVVVTGSRHIVVSFETLYEIRQLANATRETAGSSGAASVNCPSGSSMPVVLCDYHARPSQSGPAYRCPSAGHTGNRSS